MLEGFASRKRENEIADLLILLNELVFVTGLLAFVVRQFLAIDARCAFFDFFKIGLDHRVDDDGWV
ncbi:MAG: hypothetical protein R3E58_09925 [Phycisphaerae bacterium]